MSTIYALATARGRAGIGIIRISGPRTKSILKEFVGGSKAELLQSQPRRLLRAKLCFRGDLIDDALAVFFDKRSSFTGEDVVEFHVHGAPPVIKAVYDGLDAIAGGSKERGHENALKDNKIREKQSILSRLHTVYQDTQESSNTNIRLARAGEFTQRALLNNRLTLPQVEATSSLLASHTQSQRRAAMQQLSPSLLKECTGWTEEILEIVAMVEGWIDFGETDGVGALRGEDGLDSVNDGNFVGNANVCKDGNLSLKVATKEPFTRQIHRLTGNLISSLGKQLESSKISTHIRDGYSIAIVGSPNAGKSTLVNGLAGRDVAIVSEQKGTTRDAVEVAIEVDGWSVRVIDTAGLRGLQRDCSLSIDDDKGVYKIDGDIVKDAVEVKGIEKTIETALISDHIIYLVSSAELMMGDGWIETFKEFVKVIKDKSKESESAKITIIIGKSDLWPEIAIPQHSSIQSLFTDGNVDGIRFMKSISGDMQKPQTEQPPHLESIQEIVKGIVKNRLGKSDAPNLPLLYQHRHIQHIAHAHKYLKEFGDIFDDDPVVGNGYLRMALLEIGSIGGGHSGGQASNFNEQVLDRIFKQFCIGK